MDRESIIEQLTPLIAEFISKAKSGRFRNEQQAKLRLGYANSAARLITAFNALYKDKELDELKQEVEELKNVIEQAKNGD